MQIEEQFTHFEECTTRMYPGRVGIWTPHHSMEMEVHRWGKMSEVIRLTQAHPLLGDQVELTYLIRHGDETVNTVSSTFDAVADSHEMEQQVRLAFDDMAPTMLKMGVKGLWAASQRVVRIGLITVFTTLVMYAVLRVGMDYWTPGTPGYGSPVSIVVGVVLLVIGLRVIHYTARRAAAEEEDDP